MESSIGSRVCSQKLQKCSDGVDVGAAAIIPVDRLSNLPDSLICYILSFLPTKYVVRTRLLSKRWKSIWTEVNSFDFYDDLIDDYQFENGEARPGFADFINWVLIHNKSKAVEKFRLEWLIGYQPVQVKRWLSDVIGRNIKDLDLHVQYYNEILEVRLPPALFISKTLETLELNGPFLFKVPKMVSLPKLTDLVLKAVLYKSDNSFRRLTCGSPVLSSLTIKRDLGDNFMRCHISSVTLTYLQFGVTGYYNQSPPQIKIDAPALEYFFMEDDVMPKLSFKGLTSLCEVELHLCLPVKAKYVDAIVKAVQAVHCTEFLRLSHFTCLGLNCATTKLSARFEKLTKLELDLPCCKWSFLTDFLHCFVKLEILHIGSITGRCEGHHITCWREPMHVPECMLYSLAHVVFSCFERREDELNLLKYILRHGLVMERMIVSWYANNNNLEERYLILKKVLMFPRASSSCQIKFSERS